MGTSVFLWRMTSGNFILGGSEPAKIRAGVKELPELSIKVVPATGLEPVRCYSLEPESSASANSATRACPTVNPNDFPFRPQSQHRSEYIRGRRVPLRTVLEPPRPERRSGGQRLKPTEHSSPIASAPPNAPVSLALRRQEQGEGRG